MLTVTAEVHMQCSYLANVLLDGLPGPDTIDEGILTHIWDMEYGYWLRETEDVRERMYQATLRREM
jgi:hypothetical protein